MPETTYEQAFADVASCLNSKADDSGRRRAITTLLIEFGWADNSIENETDEIVLNLAKQAVVTNCGPGAWNGA